MPNLPFLANFTVQHAADMILWTLPDGQIIYVNTVCNRYLGYTTSQLLQQNVVSLLAQETAEGWKKKWRDLRLNGQRRREYRVITNTESNLLVNALEYFAPGGEEGYCCMYWRPAIGDHESTARAELPANRQYQLEEILPLQSSTGIISRNKKYRKVLKTLEKVADTDATVLIQGETGTGKELLAQAIYQLSSRRKGPFIKVNCAAIPEELAGSELFGHEKGAFTGAFQRKIGRFELADGGTLFLDEIGELPILLQPKLLRVLQEGEFERLGSSQTLKVNVRLIVATNRDLAAMIRENKFREDLFYRLNVFPINNLPLRERKDDIPLLVKYFIEKFNQKMGRKVRQVSQKDMEALLAYDFPGNIRELENIIERAIIISKGENLDLGLFIQRK